MIKLVKALIETLGWLFIAGGTTLGAGLISFLIYYQWQNETIAIAVLIIGFVIGSLWAKKSASNTARWSGCQEAGKLPNLVRLSS